MPPGLGPPSGRVYNTAPFEDRRKGGGSPLAVVLFPDFPFSPTFHQVASSSVYRYLTYGLRIDSDVQLPELARASRGTPDVRIVRTDCLNPDGPPSSATRTLSWESVGAFQVSGGQRIEMSLNAGTDEALARLPLLGPVIGTLLRQRGHLVLHASSVAIDGRAVAFIGHKGFGKSTTAASLQARGHPLVADDVLPVTVNGSAVVWPGYPQLKLWPEAAEAALGDDPERLQNLHDRVSKKGRTARGAPPGVPLSLDAVYVLDRGETLQVTKRSKTTAFLELLRHTYAPDQLHDGDDAAAADCLKQYTALAEAVAVRTLIRPRDLRSLDALARLVERDVRRRDESAREVRTAPPVHG